MYCKKCGIRLEEGTIFCPECGEKVQVGNYSSNEGTVKTQIYEEKKDYIGALKENSNGFLNYIISVLKEPIMNFEKLDILLKGQSVYLYLLITLLINSLVGWSQSKVIFKTLGSLDFGFFSMGDIMGNALSDMNSKVIVYGFLLGLLMYSILGALMIFVYKIILKVNISFTQVMKLICNAVVILMFGNLVILICAILSLKLMIIAAILSGVIFTAVINVQCISNLGYKPRFIYSFPVLWCASIVLAYYVYIKFII